MRTEMYLRETYCEFASDRTMETLENVCSFTKQYNLKKMSEEEIQELAISFELCCDTKDCLKPREYGVGCWFGSCCKGCSDGNCNWDYAPRGHTVVWTCDKEGRFTTM